MFFELIKNLLALYLCLFCWASFILLLNILLLFRGFSCWRLPLSPFLFFIFVMWLAWHAVVEVFDYPILGTKERKNVLFCLFSF